MRLEKFEHLAEAGRLAGFTGALPADVLQRHRPQMHLALVDGQRVAARCSTWVESVHYEQSRQTGVVGHFYAEDAAAGARVLDSACAELQARGCDLALGPMDGNTWRSYRLVTDRGTRPAFFLEPENPEHFVTAFAQAGFSGLAEYFSAEVADLSVVDQRLTGVARRLQAAGVTIRPLDMQAFARDAAEAFAVSLQAFRSAFLYTPLDEAEFLASYQKLKPIVRPELCLIAEQRGKTVGFVLALPDMLQAKRGEKVDTLIVKTLAVLPGREFAGLGALLVEQAQHRARAAGFTRAIHALMHESNNSRNISGKDATIRRYTLFARPL